MSNQAPVRCDRQQHLNRIFLVLVTVLFASGCDRLDPAHTKAMQDLSRRVGELESAVVALRVQKKGLEQALEVSLDAQERLQENFSRLSEKTREDITLVRERLNDIELHREANPTTTAPGSLAREP